MRLPPRRIRRALLPLIVATLAGLGALAAVVAAAALLVAPLTPRRRALRASSFVAAYCAIEIVAVTGAAAAWLRRPAVGGSPHRPDPAWTAANQRILVRALDRILAAARRCFGFDVQVVGGPDPACFGADEPVLVLARHAGPGDSFALAHLLMTRYHRRLRVVLKDLLQLDPGLDLLLNRMGCCFLPAGGDQLADRLAALAGELGRGDALLMFPEGGNWTPDRHRRAVERLEAGGLPEAATRARALPHVLPPRPGGVLAILEARPETPVVVVAHAGLDEVVSVAQAWAAVPITVPMTLEAWAAPAPPGDEAGRVAWLEAEWAAIDRWVDQVGRATHPTAGPAATPTGPAATPTGSSVV